MDVDGLVLGFADLVLRYGGFVFLFLIGLIILICMWRQRDKKKECKKCGVVH